MVPHGWFLSPTLAFKILHALPPASAVSVALPISSVLTGHLNGYTLSTLVFYLLSSPPGILSPLLRSTCAMVCLVKLSIILQELDLHLGSLLWPPKQR